ncbi:hypothetical protein DVH24_027584 [Malus domestica]|uniref:Uncharacterized protein n=1 Tax=Malus domestica TaxID=3750 RepID=A0A498HDQ3_MALDO|nr:hypothetical protein DVH24_027584 [Malus domestica]
MAEMTQSMRRQAEGKAKITKEKKMAEMTQSTSSSSEMKKSTSSSSEMKPRPKLVPLKLRSGR